MELKRPTTFEEQICKLSERHCIITDKEECIDALKRINYYRLSAYFLPFKGADDTYRIGTTFQQVYRIYEFDRKMRQILLQALEEIEINLRTKLAYYHAHAYGATGYLDPKSFNKWHNHETFMAKLEHEIKSNDRSLVVKHHMKKYEGKFPIWVATEMFSFGMLSHFFSDIKPSEQEDISKRYFKSSSKQIRSWLRCCTDIRNICAHFGRLYYRRFAAVPAHPDEWNESMVLGRSLFDNIVAMKCLHPNHSEWNNAILVQIDDLVMEYQSDIKLEHIGFPAEWDMLLKKL